MAILKVKEGSLLARIPSIPIRVWLVGLLALVALSAAFYFWPSGRETLIFFSAALLGISAVGSNIYAARTLQIFLDRETRSPVEMAFHYAERWNDPQMYHVRDACRQIMDMRGDAPEAARARIDENEPYRKNIRPILNFLEELSIAVRTGRADGETSNRFFAGIVINLFQVTEEWIKEQRRNRNRPKLWIELQWLYNQWKEN